MQNKNISFGKLGSLGRLGNQLFQIASTIGIAVKNNATYSFPNWIYQKYFHNGLPVGKAEAYNLNEPFFHYYDFDIRQNCNLHGYLQSEKYWQHCIPKIMEQFKFNLEFKQQVQLKYASILNNKKPKIAISIRRGDFVNNSNYAQLTINYYFSALERHFPNWRTMQLVIFSDDIAYCKMHFHNYPNVYFVESSNKHLQKENYFNENAIAIEQLCLGSMCNHFILSNSTFSWWMAYLGETSISKIIRPVEILAGSLKAKNNTKDFYPNRWTIHDTEKINLRDTTFMIPVSYDHADRAQNLSLNVCMLQRYYHTNIIIMEQGSQKFEHYKNYGCEYSVYNKNVFHRTAMLNQMAEQARTTIIVNWDADMFISPVQLLYSIEQIRNAKADVVYPYDGRFARVPRAYFKELEKNMDIGIFKEIVFKGMHKEDKSSVGGAIVFNRAKYFAGGGENETFVAYGPEDVEREVRFKKLGYKVMRTPGPIYHLDHFKGPNSKCNGNPYDKQNHDELEKIYSLSPDALREYVNAWPLTKKYLQNAN